MHDAPLKILATAYDANGEMSSYAIGIGRKWLGSINRDGRFFAAKIGPATGKGLTPENAARQAWIAFCDWKGDAYGLARPGSVDMQRITLRSTSQRSMNVLAGVKIVGEVIKLNDGRWRATVGDAERTGVCAMASARLAWIKKLDGEANSRDS